MDSNHNEKPEYYTTALVELNETKPILQNISHLASVDTEQHN